MKINIEIDQSNAAFEQGYDSLTGMSNSAIETQRILHELVRWKLPFQGQGFHEGPIYDLNGNKCGKWEVINK